MKIPKHLGIWMDHSKAHLMELVNGPIDTKIINADFDHHDKESTLEKSEKGMHNKQNTASSAYYKELEKTILQYDDILLFGPTEAKTELFNHLRKDHRFDKTKIEIKSTDKMTENQEHAYVRAYFSHS